MSKEATWKFADDIVVEPDRIRAARAHSAELGVSAISPGIGAQASVIVAASGARSIIEIGTGVGVSGLWLLHGSADATLTTIDCEVEYQQDARQLFTAAGVSTARARLITGFAAEVLPRMNENSYDVVFVDADPGHVVEYVEHALRLARVGGTVLVPHALWRDKVADPVQRDETTRGFRTLVTETAESRAVRCAISPVSDGLLQITRVGV